MSANQQALWAAIVNLTQTKRTFYTHDLYGLISENVFDGNPKVFTGKNVKANIRDCLQELRKRGNVRFIDNGGTYYRIYDAFDHPAFEPPTKTVAKKSAVKVVPKFIPTSTKNFDIPIGFNPLWEIIARHK